MSARDQQGATIAVTPAALARAQAERRKQAWGMLPRKEQQHLISMARETLLTAKEMSK